MRLLYTGVRLACLISSVWANTQGTNRAVNSSVSQSKGQPISFDPDQNWDGIDGQWSSFTLQVGSPPQFVRTFVSFAAYQTWVVLPQGCQAAQDFDACASARGSLFYTNESSTFDRVGIYTIWVDQNLDMFSNAIYGYDKVTLGGYGEEGPTLENTTVGAMAMPVHYLGIFGVNPKPTNFSTFTAGSPSYMTQLKTQGLIPSVSAGYTAGAPYRFDGVLASLTLGGFDQARFIPNALEFTFGPDNDRDIILAVQSITTPSKTPSSPTATLLLPNPIYAYIDSTVAQIWLPLEACLAFEAEFGLIYDNATQLYLVNDTLHDDLVQRSANITFTLASGFDSHQTVDIVLPYAAFDLTATPPYQGIANSSRYFPLRRATNATQYTLGRTFLQEAYLSVNWEAQRFNVSQVSWVANVGKDIVAMPAGPAQQSSVDPSVLISNNNSQPNGSNRLSTGAIGGIVGGVVAALLAILVLVLVFRNRRRYSKEEFKHEKLDDEVSSNGQTTVFPKAELEGSAANPFSPAASGLNHGPGSPTAATDVFNGSESIVSPTTPFCGSSFSRPTSQIRNGPTSPISEADGQERIIYEMPGDFPTINEKDSRVLSEKEVQLHRERVYNGVDTNSTASLNQSQTSIFQPLRAMIPPSNVALIRIGRDYPSQSHSSSTQSSGGSAPVSPAVFGEGSSSTQGVEPTLSRSPIKPQIHRAFSFEQPLSPFGG